MKRIKIIALTLTACILLTGKYLLNTYETILDPV